MICPAEKGGKAQALPCLFVFPNISAQAFRFLNFFNLADFTF